MNNHLFITLFSSIALLQCDQSKEIIYDDLNNNHFKNTIQVQNNVLHTTSLGMDSTVLDIVYNNDEYTATIVFPNAHEEVLKGMPVASGMWYKNDHYELRGKGQNITVQKDGIEIFKSNHTDFLGPKEIWVKKRKLKCSQHRIQNHCLEIKSSYNDLSWQEINEEIIGFTSEPNEIYHLLVDVDQTIDSYSKKRETKYILLDVLN